MGAGPVIFTAAHGTKHVCTQDCLDSYVGTADENGQRHGQGVYSYPNSFFKYRGQYVHGLKQGNPLNSVQGSVDIGTMRWMHCGQLDSTAAPYASRSGTMQDMEDLNSQMAATSMEHLTRVKL
jgi:hypothetical protein